jgi:hypothetical protein
MSSNLSPRVHIGEVIRNAVLFNPENPQDLLKNTCRNRIVFFLHDVYRSTHQFSGRAPAERDVPRACSSLHAAPAGAGCVGVMPSYKHIAPPERIIE